MKKLFLDAIRNRSLPDLQKIPKSDIHSHAGRAGNLRYIERWACVKIAPPEKPFDSLGQMQEWYEWNVKRHTPGMQGYLKRIEAAFAQAQEDHVQILALSFGIDEIDTFGSMESFMSAINELHRHYAPDTRFYPELSFGREAGIDSILNRLDQILSCRWFTSVDICNNEFAQPIRNFKPVYRLAKSYGLRLKAHVGEFGGADDVKEAVEELELDEVHHGIAAAGSVPIMHWLADHRIRLNVCPTSNVMLKVAESYALHPIRKLYDHAVPVTINTDDLVIFNQSVSGEYMNLYESGLMTAEELNTIRETGLGSYLND